LFIGEIQMDIKSFLYQKEEKKRKGIWLIITIIIIIVFFVCIIALNKTDKKINIEHFIWEKISTTGTISIDNNYPTNTHKLSNSIENFGLKESSINLNNFLDTQVQIDWNISEFTTKYPILLISKLKIPSYKLYIANNKFFYTDKLISFDFSKDIDVYSKKNAWWIVIYYQNEPILYVDTFICSNITETQNCEKMKQSYIMDLTETFQSTLWYTFYKNKENSWITFNDDNVWYIFRANSDEDMLNLSHLIYIVDSNFLVVNKSDFLLSWCSTNDIEMQKILEITKGILDDNLIQVSIIWRDKNKDKISCKLNIDIFNDWDIVNSTISIIE